MVSMLLGIGDWWSSIQKFFHEMNQVVKILIITVCFLIALLALIRFIKPKYSVDKNKFRIMPIIVFAIFMGIGCFVLFI